MGVIEAPHGILALNRRNGRDRSKIFNASIE
jgi:hypothetical protein